MSVDAATDGTNDAPDSGAWAVDEDADDDDLLLVLEQTETRADEYVIYEMPEGDDDITVAKYNEEEGYDPDEHVVFAVYQSSLNECLDDWSVEEVLQMYEEEQLEETGVKRYSFPETRLKHAGE